MSSLTRKIINIFYIKRSQERSSSSKWCISAVKAVMWEVAASVASVWSVACAEWAVTTCMWAVTVSIGGCHRRCVYFYSLYVGFTADMWVVTASMWAVTGAVLAVQ